MKTSGLLCRADERCDAVFMPQDANTVKSLLEAAARRDAHELEVHGYTHKRTTVEHPNFAAGPRARAKRNKDLDPVV